MSYRSFIVTCSKCETPYRVEEVGTRFPWIDKEEYYCPKCKECGGSIRTHYNLKETIIDVKEDSNPPTFTE